MRTKLNSALGIIETNHRCSVLFWSETYGRQLDATFKKDCRNQLFSNSRDRRGRRWTTSCASRIPMAQLESVYNFTSKSNRICALHRALHRALDLDGFRSLDAKSKQHERHVDGLRRCSEIDFDAFDLIPEKWCIEAASCASILYWSSAASTSSP